MTAKPLSDLGLDQAAIQRLVDDFGASIKIKNESGAFIDLLAEHLATGIPGGGISITTPDNYDKISGPNQTHEKVTGTHEKGAKTGNDQLIRPGDEGVFLNGLSEADLVKLFERSQDILKGKAISIIKK